MTDKSISQVRHALFTLTVALAAAVWVFGSSAASANPRYAAFVVHADTGDVLFDRYSTAERYPASLTKMMTLYLLFEAMAAGEVDLDDKMTVSKRASLQPASKLGLARGSSISTETAINALVIRSANDVATVVAEHLAGSESRFARQMTDKARALGMRNTTFRNASGLPDGRQVTTAKDMAILSQRIVQDFPEYFHFFDDETFRWDGRTYKSHNRVTKRLDGADGLKTGYTRASGYNLATTAHRGEHRLIGIVLGGRSGATRDAHMIKIMDQAFADIAAKPELVKSIISVKPTPSLRPDRRAPKTLVSVDPGLVGAVETFAPSDGAERPLEVSALASVIEDASPAPFDEAVIGEGDADMSLVRDWAIQVGAYRSQSMAIARIHSTQEEIREIWSDVGREVNIAQNGGRSVYRARFTRLTEGEAQAGCAAIRESGGDCLALAIGN